MDVFQDLRTDRQPAIFVPKTCAQKRARGPVRFASRARQRIAPLSRSVPTDGLCVGRARYPGIWFVEFDRKNLSTRGGGNRSRPRCGSFPADPRRPIRETSHALTQLVACQSRRLAVKLIARVAPDKQSAERKKVCINARCFAVPSARKRQKGPATGGLGWWQRAEKG